MIIVIIVAIGIGIWYAYSARGVNRRPWLWGIIGFIGAFEFYVQVLGLIQAALRYYANFASNEAISVGFIITLPIWACFVIGLWALVLRKRKEADLGAPRTGMPMHDKAEPNSSTRKPAMLIGILALIGVILGIVVLFRPSGPMPLTQTASDLGQPGFTAAGGRGDPDSLPAVQSAQSQSFVLTGPMKSAHNEHTASLLRNGEVLVAGGETDSVAGGDTQRSIRSISDAELYSPGSGTWKQTGGMTTARGSHTATLLPHGTVLIAGGHQRVGGNPAPLRLSTAEIYFPATGKWAVTGSMSVPRDLATATLLPNGKVLMVGGYDGTKQLATAEVFDPTTRTWSLTETSMATPRIHHQATLLSNGTVLITGGFNDKSQTLSSSELFDPKTGKWDSTGSMTTALADHTATVLPNGKVLVAGGASGFVAWSGAELYDVMTKRWERTGALNVTRKFHAATLLQSGQVLVVGGTPNSSQNLSSTEIYDPAAGTWKPMRDMNSRRESPTVTLLTDGNVLVAGGFNSEVGRLSTAELFDPGP